MTDQPTPTEQLTRLVQPFAQRLIHTNPSGGGSYVSHSAVTEKLLAVVGPYDYQIRELRGFVPGIVANPQASSKRAKEGRPALENAVVGCIGRLTLHFSDGSSRTVEEAGDCEDPHNWPHDGARMKDASSDAFKRCAMRFGVGIHMWSQYQGKSEFFLHDYLAKQNGTDSDASDTSAA